MNNKVYVVTSRYYDEYSGPELITLDKVKAEDYAYLHNYVVDGVEHQVSELTLDELHPLCENAMDTDLERFSPLKKPLEEFRKLYGYTERNYNGEKPTIG